MRTFLLDTKNWDLVLDATNNIAVAENPYALAQDAASAIRLFSGELYYDTTQGVPYFQSILGQWPPLSYVKAKLAQAAETVPEVVAAQCFIASFKDRAFAGQVQTTDDEGNISRINF